MKIKTFVALILDKSGSMDSLKDFAVKTFNEQIQTLKAESNSPKESTLRLLKGRGNVEGVETKLTLVSFNDNVQFHNFNEDVNAINEFPAEEYKPNGSTALFDAIGETIDRFTAEIPDLAEEDSGALIIVVTDGQENASKRYGGEEGRKKLKERIEELQKTDKWTITFMGAEKVLETAVDHLGFNAGNTANWDPSKGMAFASAVNTVGTRNYMSTRLMGTTSVKDFYEGTDEKEVEEEVQNYKKKYENLKDSKKA